jgi:hypothetical protein
MNRKQWILALAGFLACASAARAQVRPYIGFVYPAGGQQGTTFHVHLGGQGLDDVNQAVVSGKGVSAKVVEYHRRLSPQEMQLLREQATELRRAAGLPGRSRARPTGSGAAATSGKASAEGKDNPSLKLISKIENRMAEFVARPACASIANLVFVEVTITSDAEPGQRELVLATPRGVSNPLVFCVGQVPEVSRKPMRTADFQVLGKEELALRKRPDEEVEVHIPVPCTMNGQIASGEVNRYRFEARKGQRLVISTLARQLVPYIADAVPGWFQPVLALCDANGKELAYNDDYRFKPDPVVFYEVPKDGEYVLNITDAIYRGREDFVYRVTIGELPFVTSIFPLGGRAGSPAAIDMKGWNLQGAELALPSPNAEPGTYLVTASGGGAVSNRVPFALDALPECLDKEPNNDAAHAQKVKLPIIVNGHMNRADDWDVFQVSGREGDTIVAEVAARRLESPLDSVLKFTDSSGKILAFNDDREDPTAGVNTHDADSYLSVKLPADGTYYVHLGDAARSGGEEFAYRLRLSAPRPDFALRVVPSSVTVRGRSSSALAVHVIRKDGFTGPIELKLKDPPEGFSSYPVKSVPPKQPGTPEVARLGLRTDMTASKRPVTLSVVGRAMIDGRDVTHAAVPAEDRMQAFLWRHLVPAEQLEALVFDPSFEPVGRRGRRPATPPTPAKTATSSDAAAKPKFTRQQVAGRLRQLKLLFDEGLLTEEFNRKKVAECEAAL